TLAASAASLPDSPFYSVKLFVEDVAVTLAQPEQKPQLYVQQASTRVEEATVLMQQGKINEAERTVNEAAQRVKAAETARDRVSHTSEMDESIGVMRARTFAAAEAVSAITGTSPAISISEPSSIETARGALSRVSAPVGPFSDSIIAPPGAAPAQAGRVAVPGNAVIAPGASNSFIP